jgi:hypothetical protein
MKQMIMSQNRVKHADQQNQPTPNFEHNALLQGIQVKAVFEQFRQIALDPTLPAQRMPPAMLYRHYKYMTGYEQGQLTPYSSGARLDFINAVNEYTGLQAKTLTGLQRGLAQLIDAEKIANRQQHGRQQQAISTGLAGLGIGMIIGGVVLAMSNIFGAVITGAIGAMVCGMGLLYFSAFTTKIQKDREQYAHNKRLLGLYEILQQSVDTALNHVLSDKDREIDRLWQKYYETKDLLDQYQETHHLSVHSMKQKPAKLYLKLALRGLNNVETMDTADIDDFLTFAQSQVNQLPHEQEFKQDHEPVAHNEQVWMRERLCQHAKNYLEAPEKYGAKYANKLLISLETMIGSNTNEALSNEALADKLAELELWQKYDKVKEVLDREKYKLSDCHIKQKAAAQIYLQLAFNRLGHIEHMDFSEIDLLLSNAEMIADQADQLPNEEHSHHKNSASGQWVAKKPHSFFEAKGDATQYRLNPNKPQQMRIS